MKRLVLLAAASAGILAGSVAPTAATAAPAVFHHPRIPGHAVHAAGWSASNWSGYAKSGSYTSATAQWVVPSVSATKQASYSSAWVGIDGFTNSSLIQTGTESDYYNRAAHYNAWWEILPAPETPITTFAVRPGDVMSASITKGSGSSWTITIKDLTNGGSFTTTQNYTGPGTSVEWIEEAPTVGGRVATLAHYSSPDTFDPGTANGSNPGLTPADSGVMIQKRAQVSTPSDPDSDADGFNMSYGSTAPAPPSS
ncbi:MAG TPA: G1 family glutamic endopeptidase [Mycobacteriales bacterium]|nr:G1 family glutamic endopeptidase [Mycobacteriales bacterium]